VAKVGTSNQDRTISLKAAIRSCTKKQKSKDSAKFSPVISRNMPMYVQRKLKNVRVKIVAVDKQ
jgi:hypothetical protein